MRELKFRAWGGTDRNNPYMTKPFTLYARDRWYERYPDFYAVMQYTGLKDKNGKEIYEGDILEYPETSYPLIVKWDDLTSSYYLEEIQDGGSEPIPYKDSMEKYGLVIGNIIENKELLGAKKC